MKNIYDIDLVGIELPIRRDPEEVRSVFLATRDGTWSRIGLTDCDWLHLKLRKPREASPVRRRQDVITVPGYLATISPHLGGRQ